jgi:hypothetical protein
MKINVHILLAGLVILLLAGYGLKAQKVSYNYDQSRFNPYVNRISYSIGIGISAYNGELSKFFNPSRQFYYMNPAGGFGVAYRFFDHLSLRGDLNVFTLATESFKYKEKNRFFSGINIDYYLNAVVDLFPKGKIDGRFYKWDGHIFGGIGQVVFFPNYNETRDRKTGIIVPSENPQTYSRLSVIYPIGAGAKYYIDKNHYISLEGIYRFTRTDFLDGLKDLSHPQFDKYFSLMFKYTVIIDTSPRKTFEYDRYIKGRKKRIKE